jgi:2,3,4,5-tetrahydropyridine-2-carboxylate N-succinyltransferase
MQADSLRKIIDEAYEQRSSLTPRSASPALRKALDDCLGMLDSGTARVAEKRAGNWVVNEWLKKAVLLSFRTTTRSSMPAIRVSMTRCRLAHSVGGARLRKSARAYAPCPSFASAHVGSNVVLMPSFVNVGAHVGEGTMIDTWATVGSCAQIGKNVHLSGGAGIGGVLEPVQATPTIIEDNCFIGARSEIVEGVVVEEGSVIAMGVTSVRHAHTIAPGRPPAGPAGSIGLRQHRADAASPIA